MTGKVEWLPFSIGWGDPDIPVEVGVALRVGDPFAIRRPVVLRSTPGFDETLGVFAVHIRHPEIASSDVIADLLAARNEDEVMLDLPVFGDPGFFEFAIPPPVVIGVGSFDRPDVGTHAIVTNEKYALPVRAHDRLSLFGRGGRDGGRLFQLGVHDPDIAACGKGHFEAILAEAHIGCLGQCSPHRSIMGDISCRMK